MNETTFTYIPSATSREIWNMATPAWAVQWLNFWDGQYGLNAREIIETIGVPREGGDKLDQNT